MHARLAFGDIILEKVFTFLYLHAFADVVTKKYVLSNSFLWISVDGPFG